MLSPLIVCLAAVASDCKTLSTPQDPPQAVIQHPLGQALPGQRAGTERWIVMFRSRSFDLEAYAPRLRGEVGLTATDAAVGELEARVQLDQAEFVTFAKSLGGELVNQYWLVNACAIEIEPSKLAEILRHPNVSSVQPDLLRMPGIKTATNAANHASDALTAAGIKGEGVTIAIVDSGADSNTGSTGRPHRLYYIDGNPSNQQGGGIGGSRLILNRAMGAHGAEDPISHGTSVAAVAAGEVWNSGPNSDNGHAPLAKIASYSVANDAFGGTSASILAATWQQIAADAARFNIRVANCSYQGYFAPDFIDQVALDNLARINDILITGMAGNAGSDTIYAYGATNMLAVGAVDANARTVASFSARGPLANGNGRFYPDLVANGVAIAMPLGDSEAADRIGSGTSYSAPQVAGGAALFRSIAPAAGANEVRAAILATCEDVALRNPSPPYNNRNAYGAGYLRIDRLVRLGQGNGLLRAGFVAMGQPAQFQLPVSGGSSYSVAIAWFRTNGLGWSNLDLSVFQGSQLLAESRSPNNVYEFLRFVAPADGTVDLRIQATRLETGMSTQSFGLAAAEATGVTYPGSFQVSGNACGLDNMPSLLGGALTPQVGRSYEVIYDRPVNRPPYYDSVFLATGLSDTRLGSANLPINLAPFGASGCTLQVSLELTMFGTTTPQSGELRYVIPLPLDPFLVGGRLYHQAFYAEPRYSLGFGTSRHVTATIGGVR